MTESTFILHVGDLHAGMSADTGETGKAKFEAVLSKAREFARSHPISAIIATGDLGYRGEKKHLEEGLAQLAKLHQECPRPDDVTVVVAPGNHDVEWPVPATLETWDGRERYKLLTGLLDATTQYGRFVRPVSIAVGGGKINFELAKNVAPSLHWFRELQPSGAPSVFVFPLSSVGLSGTPAFGPSDEVFSYLESASRGRKGKTDLALFRRLATADIPYVDPLQLDCLEWLVQQWKETEKDRYEAFTKAIKIAVLHHPLVSLSTEEKIRPYDVVANCGSVLTKLSSLGFHLVLYGHKHRLGIHTNFGTWHCTYPVVGGGSVSEVSGVAGGNLILEGGTERDHFGFNVIEVRPDVQETGCGCRVIVTSFAGESLELGPSMPVITVGRTGRPVRTRWIHGTKPATDVLARGNGLAVRFAQVVQKIEQRYREGALNEDMLRYYPDADHLVMNSLDMMEDFSEGARGVSVEFINGVFTRAQDAGAMYFVDTEGWGTWFQPNLLVHLVGMFKAFVARNYQALNRGKWQDGAWRHREIIQTARFRICQLARRHEGAAPDANVPVLPFDLARILVWSKDHLVTAPGRALVRLHELFDVPLFWVDTDGMPGLPPDFHAEWGPERGCEQSPCRALKLGRDERGQETRVSLGQNEALGLLTDLLQGPCLSAASSAFAGKREQPR